MIQSRCEGAFDAANLRPKAFDLLIRTAGRDGKCDCTSP